MFGHDDNQQKDEHTTVNPTNQDPDMGGLSLPGTSPAHTPANSADDMLTVPDTPSPDVAPAADNEELLNLKRNALEELIPLVDHLDQTSEEKFKTTMMMIQATDDPGLVKIAYQAAKDIKDEKVRAQALLDIVNEINYFTQHGEK